jgi:hypothetical protein
MAGQINLPQLYSHTSGVLHGVVSELMASCACQSFRSAAWSSRRSSDLARSISRHVADVCRFLRRRWGLGRGGCSGARMLVRRWCICRYSPTSSVGYSGSWSKEARGRAPVDVPQGHVPRWLQRAYSSTHKASLAMVLFWIWQWRRPDVSSNVRLDSVGVWRRPLVLASVEKPRDSSVFFYPLGFSLQSVQDNCFLLVCLCLLAFMFGYSCNMIFI